MLKLLVMVVGCASLVACASKERLAEEARQDCLALGYEAGTEAFADCQLEMRAIQAQERAAKAAASAAAAATYNAVNKAVTGQ